MGGFPTRPNRTAFGPTYEEYKPVRDPKRELGQDVVNLMMWQLGGLSQAAQHGWLTALVSGGAVTTQNQALSWDPNGALSNLSWTYEGTGIYSFAFAQQYPDENGTNQNLILRGGLIVPWYTKTGKFDGTHTGANNQATLTDSAQAWTTNELVDNVIFNITDGSQTTITANTATTVTGVLSGGTDDDWDTSDKYLIAQPSVTGIIEMISDYSGFVLIRSTSGTPVDPLGFMAVWF